MERKTDLLIGSHVRMTAPGYFEGAVQELLDKTDIDEKIMEKAGALKDKAVEAKEKATDFIENNGLDEKVKGAAATLKGKADELLEKTDIDDKIKAQAEVIKDKAEEFKNMAEGKVENAAAEAEEVKDAAVETVEQVAEEVKGK